MLWRSRLVCLLALSVLAVWLFVGVRTSAALAQTVTFPAAVTDTTAQTDCPAGTDTFTSSDLLAVSQLTENACAAAVQGSDDQSGWSSAVVFTLVAMGVAGLTVGTAATVKVLWSK